MYSRRNVIRSLWAREFDIAACAFDAACSRPDAGTFEAELLCVTMIYVLLASCWIFMGLLCCRHVLDCAFSAPAVLKTGCFFLEEFIQAIVSEQRSFGTA